MMQATAGDAGLMNLRCHVANKFKALICPCDALVHGLILLLKCQLLLQWLENFASLKNRALHPPIHLCNVLGIDCPIMLI